MYEVVWDVEDEVFGGTYSLRQACISYEEAWKFAQALRKDGLVSNVEICGGEYE